MHFNLLTVLSLTTLSFASPVPSRSAASDNSAAVINALAKVSSSTTTLNNTVANYPGGLAGTLDALAILKDSYAVIDDIKSATRIASSSVNFTDPESQSVATAFVNLVPVVEASLTTIDGKKSDFETGLLGIGSLTGLVLSTVKKLKGDSDALANAIIAKLTPTWAGLAPLVLAQVDAAFQKVIDDYS